MKTPLITMEVQQYTLDLSSINCVRIDLCEKIEYCRIIMDGPNNDEFKLRFGCEIKFISLIKQALLYVTRLTLDIYTVNQLTMQLLKEILFELTIEELQVLCGKYSDFYQIVEYFGGICLAHKIEFCFGRASERYHDHYSETFRGTSQSPNDNNPNHKLHDNQEILELISMILDRNVNEVQLLGMYYSLKELNMPSDLTIRNE